MSAHAMADAIRNRKLSSVEAVANALQRIEALNGKLNCFCFLFAEEALSAAREADAAIARGDRLGRLHGVPIGFKDMTPVRGKRTTRGSRLFEHWVPDRNAAIVDRLLGEGAIIVGKTTTSELAYSFITATSLWGVTRNPWNLDHTPGGSSGGSAAAVASGCLPLAEGSDMGGSVRLPASFCGLVGLKPSFGRIPFDILPSQFDSFCHFGPLARSVADAALFLDAAQGPDDRDASSLPSLTDPLLSTAPDLRGLASLSAPISVTTPSIRKWPPTRPAASRRSVNWALPSKRLPCPGAGTSRKPGGCIGTSIRLCSPATGRIHSSTGWIRPLSPPSSAAGVPALSSSRKWISSAPSSGNRSPRSLPATMPSSARRRRSLPSPSA
jgi:hypothetical protein